MKSSRFFLFALISFAFIPNTLAQLPQNPDWSEEGKQSTQRYGEQVTMEGDYNGDGYKDLAVGAPKTDSGQTNNGRAYLYLGSDTGLTDTAVWTATCDSGDAFFGGDLSYAGNVDDDGYDDLIVGASEMDSNMTDRGAAFLYRGNASGLEDTASWVAYGEQAYALFGYSVSNAGDVNDDGYDDVMVGAYQQDSLKSDAGRAYVFHGGSNGLSSTADWVEGIHESNAWFGQSVSYAGDLNDDGYDDVVVGAPKKGNGTDNYGRVYFYYGTSSGLPDTSSYWLTPPTSSDAQVGRTVTDAGDIDNDGYDDVVIGTDGDGAGGYFAAGKAWALHGSSSGIQYPSSLRWEFAPNDNYMRFADDLANAGDINGDGHSDLIGGAPDHSSDRGKLYLFTGSDTGYADMPTSTYEGPQIQSWFSTAVSAGDANSDGKPDIAVGAHSYSGSLSESGKAFVFMNACKEQVPNISASPAQPCVGDTALLDPGSGYSSYSWSTGDSGQVLEVLLSDTAQFSVQTVDDSGCVTSDDTTLAPAPLPEPLIIDLDSSYCSGDSAVVLNGDPSGGSFSGPGVYAGEFDPQTAGTGSHTITYSYTDSNGCTGSTDSTVIVEDCATDLAERSEKGQLALRPNPSEGNMVISHPGSVTWRIRVRDQEGRVLKRFELESREQTTRKDLNALPDALYFVEFLHREEKQKVLKWVKH